MMRVLEKIDQMKRPTNNARPAQNNSSEGQACLVPYLCDETSSSLQSNASARAAAILRRDRETGGSGSAVSRAVFRGHHLNRGALGQSERTPINGRFLSWCSSIRGIADCRPRCCISQCHL